MRSRPPRLFGENGQVIPYRYDYAAGRFFIKKLSKRGEWRSTKFIFFEFCELTYKGRNKEYTIMLTEDILYFIRNSELKIRSSIQLKLHLLKKMVIVHSKRGVEKVDLKIDLHVPIKRETQFRFYNIQKSVGLKLFEKIVKIMKDLNMFIEFQNEISGLDQIRERIDIE